MNKKLILVLVGLITSFFVFSQQTDSIAIKKGNFPADYNRQYATVIFQFFYLNTGKEIKAVALNIDDIRLSTDPQNGNGLIRVHLSDKKTYKVFVRYEMYEDSKIFNIDIDTKYNYAVEIYLSPSKKPIQ